MMPFCDFFQCEDAAPGNFRDRLVVTPNAFKEMQALLPGTESHDDADTSFAQWVEALSRQYGPTPSDGDGVNPKIKVDGDGEKTPSQTDTPVVAASLEKCASQAILDGANHGRQSRWQRLMSVAGAPSDVLKPDNGRPNQMGVAVESNDTAETNGWQWPSSEDTHLQPAAVKKPLNLPMAAWPSAAASSPASGGYRLNLKMPEASAPGAIDALNVQNANQYIAGEHEVDASKNSGQTNGVDFDIRQAALHPKASTGTDAMVNANALAPDSGRLNAMFSGITGRQWQDNTHAIIAATGKLHTQKQSIAGQSSTVGEGSRDQGQAAFFSFEGEHKANPDHLSNAADRNQKASILRPGDAAAAVQSNPVPRPVKPSKTDFSDSAVHPSNRIQSSTVAVDQTGRAPQFSTAGHAIDTFQVSASANEMPSGNPKGFGHQQAPEQQREFETDRLNKPESETVLPQRKQAGVSNHEEPRPFQLQDRVGGDPNGINHAMAMNRSGGASMDPVQVDFSSQDNDKGMAAGQQLKVADSPTASGTNDVTNTNTESTKAFQTTVMDQIVSKAAIRSIQGRNEIQIRLKPDFLGNVQMNVAGDKDQMVVRILTDQPVVKDIIETHLHQLKADLQNQGLTIDRFDVMVKTDADHQPSRDAFAQNMNQHSSQNGKRQPQERNSENHNQGNDKKQKDAYSERRGVNYFA